MTFLLAEYPPEGVANNAMLHVGCMDLCSGILGDYDSFGSSVSAMADSNHNGDGVGDLAVGAYGDDDGGSNRGAIYVLFPGPYCCK